MASVVFNIAKSKFADGTLDWDTDVIRVLLAEDGDASLLVDWDNLQDVLDPGTANAIFEVDSSPNYTRKTLANCSVTTDDTNDRAVLDADDVTWTAVGDNDDTAKGALIYKQVGGDDSTPNDDIPIAFIDFTDTTLNGGDFTIQWSANGIITLS